MADDTEIDEEVPSTSNDRWIDRNFEPNILWPSRLNLPSQLDLQNRERLLCDDPDNRGDVSPAMLNTGEVIEDTHSATGELMKPRGTSLAEVAEAAQELRALSLGELSNPIEAMRELYTGIKAAVGTGGHFDYQRTEAVCVLGYSEHTYIQHPEFRDISNFNVGVFMQQLGFDLTSTLEIAGAYALKNSSNWRFNSYFLDPQTREFIEIGWKVSAAGAFQPRIP